MIDRHPHDELVLAYAAGTLPSGPAVVVGAHLEGCAHCRERVRLARSVGGALLDEMEPVPLKVDALARVLAEIDAPATVAPAPAPVTAPAARPPLPPGVAWPRALRHGQVSRWRPLGPGMRWSRVSLPWDPEANVFLLRIGTGRSLPQHRHGGRELTQVLYGRFDDGRGEFGPGDFDEADGEVHHQPVVGPHQECICLTSVEGGMRFDGFIARTLASVIGL